MSAQVEEVTASAQSLAEMAQALQQVVAQFKLTAEQQLSENNLAKPVFQHPNLPQAGTGNNGHGSKEKTEHIFEKS